MNRQARQPIAVALLMVALILAPVLYVLSVGPAFVLADKRVIDEGLLRWTYQPVFIAAHACKVQPWLERYVDWWSGPDPFRTYSDPFDA